MNAHALGLVLVLTLGAAPAPDPLFGEAVSRLQHLAGEYEAELRSHRPDDLARRTEETEALGSLASRMASTAPRFAEKLLRLRERLRRGERPSELEKAGSRLISELVRAGRLATGPARAPDFARGATVFASACASCHGATGDGRGAVAKGLHPPPENFWEAEVMNRLTPFDAYGSITYGDVGTAMPSFPTLSEEDRWAVSFWLFRLRQAPCEGLASSVSWGEVATHTDDELAERYGPERVACLRGVPPSPPKPVALPPEKPGPPVPQALRLACIRDAQVPACERAAEALESQKLVPGVPEEAGLYLEAACELGAARDCERAQAWVSRYAEYEDFEVDVGCILRDDPFACEEIANAAEEADPAHPLNLSMARSRMRRALALHLTACARGEGAGCLGVARIRATGVGVPRDGFAADRFEARACALGLARACEEQGDRSTGGEAVKLYRRACEGTEPTPHRCLKLARASEAVHLPGTVLEARYQRACELLSFEACEWMLVHDRPAAPPGAALQEAFRRWCDSGAPAACERSKTWSSLR